MDLQLSFALWDLYFFKFFGMPLSNCTTVFVVVVVVVVLLFYVHGKHLRSCRDGQLT